MIPTPFRSAAEALASIQRCERKECRIVRSAHAVIVQTPEGMGKFSAREWEALCAQAPSR